MIYLAERQIYTFLFARLLRSRDKAGVMDLTRAWQILKTPVNVMRNPYILDFLGLPDSDAL